MFPRINLKQGADNQIEAWGNVAAFSLGIIALAHYVPYVRQLLHTAPFKNDFTAKEATNLESGAWEFGFKEDNEEPLDQPAP